MELLFETRREIIRVDGRLYFHQCKPTVHPDPVLVGDSDVDASGASLYGSVLYDGGKYRMWYQAWRRVAVSRFDSALVGYAESDDGITWHKPILNQVEIDGSKENNLVNLGVHIPSVFIDPTAPASHRYRATGCIDSRYANAYPLPDPPIEGGYFTFHSADGFHWEVDSPEPKWLATDCIFSIWHPGRWQGEVLFKRSMVHRGGMARRGWFGATMKDGVCSADKEALVSDDYDDILAKSTGHVGADYYGVAMMPANKALVGFVSQLRYYHPVVPYTQGTGSSRTSGSMACSVGEADMTIAYQSESGAQWVNTPGRPDFLSHGATPWARSGWYGGCVVECGDEQRLYITGTVGSHMAKMPDDKTLCGIGFASWPKWRLFEFRAEPQGEMEIDLGVLKGPSEVLLNYKCCNGGSVRAQILSAKPLYTLEEVEGRGKDDFIGLSGDSLGEALRWTSGSVVQPYPGRRTILRLFIEHASVFAYDVKPLRL